MSAKIVCVAGVFFFTGLTVGRSQATATNAPAGGALNASMEATNSAPAEPQISIGGEGRVNRRAMAEKEEADFEHDVGKLCEQKKYDEALARLNPAIEANPRNLMALNLRGFVYTEQGKWDLAQRDFEAILQVDERLSAIKFDIVELRFRQKQYDLARPDFAALEADPQIGDLAAYKVFLCDLFGGHTHEAREELNAFKLAGMNPSYYFSCAAWELYHKRPEDARPWLESAARIYFPAKIENYSKSLTQLGYLPLPPPPPATSASTAQ